MTPSFFRGRYLLFALVTAAFITIATTAMGADPRPGKPLTPDKSNKCPVCGMVVYRYPDFIASISFGDGHIVFFDGVKDMFKYLFNFGKYSPDRSREDIRAMFVTEYYDMQAIDASKALYVMGSDIYGPMGHELIPTRSFKDAQLFLKDHKGRRIVRFKEITPTLIGQLD